MSLESSHISPHDKEVLNRLFNPNLPYGDVVDEDENTDIVAGLHVVIKWEISSFNVLLIKEN